VEILVPNPWYLELVCEAGSCVLSELSYYFLLRVVEGHVDCGELDFLNLGVDDFVPGFGMFRGDVDYAQNSAFEGAHFLV
jgi:hypothetical protein